MHELSSAIAHDFTGKVMKSGYNMIADITMGGHPKKRTGVTGAEGTSADLKAYGYDLDAVFVEVPLAMSATSQNQRHLGGVNRLRTGVMDKEDLVMDQGGRYVPEGILAESDIGGDVTLNRANFNKMQSEGHFNRWYVVDNTAYDTTPKLIGSGSGPGRVPKFTKTKEGNRVKIVLDEDPSIIPGMYPGDPVTAPVVPVAPVAV